MTRPRKKVVPKSAPESETMFRTVFEGAPVGLVLVRVDGKGPGTLLFCNRALCALMVRDAEVLLAGGVHGVWDADAAEDLTQMKALLAGELGSSEVAVEYERADGAGRLAVQGRVEIDPSGADSYAVVRFEDVTQRRIIAATRERERRQLIEAQQIGQCGSWEWDVPGDALVWSDELCRIHGLQAGDYPRSYDAFVATLHPEDRERVDATVRAAYGSGAPYAVEYRIVRPDGAVRFMDGRGRVVVDAGGIVVRMLGIAQDVTKSREVERTKREFTSIVSHELRTPLTSIRGSLGLLESGALGELSAKAQRMVEIAVRNTDRLVRLINDILDIEHIHSGEITMRRVWLDARELIEQSVEAVAALATDAGVTLVVDAEPADVCADPDRIIQTLTNLIGNAVKFSPRDSRVRLSCVERHDDVMFEVRDEGPGIAAGDLEAIFERFHQIDATDSRQKSGTGLGLAICRSIVQQHGGRIWAQSELGHGSTFRFTLPGPGSHARAPDAQPDDTAVDVVDLVDDGDTAAPVVLVCDDDESVVEVVVAMLEHGGFRTIAAETGQQAVARALAERPDAILLDLMMPGLDGCETAAALQEHSATRDIPIVILSGLDPNRAERPDGLIVDWLSKPIDARTLLAAVANATGLPAARDQQRKRLPAITPMRTAG